MTIRILTILMTVYLNISLSQTSGTLRLTIEEKIKNDPGRKLVVNESVTIHLNDSLKHVLTTDKEGNVYIKNLMPGKYDITTIRNDCQTKQTKEIRIGEGKTAYVTVQLICDSYISSLTKKEKKKLGLK